MEEKNTPVDKTNEVYTKIEQNQKKYAELMANENAIENAIKFNAKLNERSRKLGIKTCKYVPKENEDGRKD